MKFRPGSKGLLLSQVLSFLYFFGYILMQKNFSEEEVKQVYRAGGYDVFDAPPESGFSLICRPRQAGALKNIAVLLICRREVMPGLEKLKSLLHVAKANAGSVDLVSFLPLSKEIQAFAENEADLTIVEYKTHPDPLGSNVAGNSSMAHQLPDSNIYQNSECPTGQQKGDRNRDSKRGVSKIHIAMAGAAAVLVAALFAVAHHFFNTGTNLVEVKRPKGPLIKQADVVLPESGYFTVTEVFSDSMYRDYPPRRQSQIFYQSMLALKEKGHLFIKAPRSMDKNTQNAIFSFQGMEQISESGKLDDYMMHLLGLVDLPLQYVATLNENFVNQLESEMIWVPPGTFVIHESNPPVEVTLTRGYWIGSKEVTQREWSMIMGTSIDELSAGSHQSHRPDEVGGDFPVSFVSWDDAKEFCRKLTEELQGEIPEGWCYDLPSEAQWDRARYAESVYSYKKTQGWTSENSEKRIRPVGTLEPNAWGIYDMLGNVSEWVADYYIYSLDKESPLIDPFIDKPEIQYVNGNPYENRDRVYLGGSVDKYPSSRLSGHPEVREREIGFRVVLIPRRNS